MPVVADRWTLLKSTAGFLVAGLVLYLFGRVLGWGEVFSVLRSADLTWLAIAAITSAAGLVCWAWGWGLVLSTVGSRVPVHSLVVTYYAASFVNYITPLGQTSGAPVSAYILSTDHRAPYQESLASVMTVSGLNVVPMLTFTGIGAVAISLDGNVPTLVEPVLFAAGLVTIATPLFAGTLYTRKPFVVDVVSRICEWLSIRFSAIEPDRIEQQVGNFFLLLDRVGSSRSRMLEVLALSYAGWALFVAPMWFAGKALGVTLDPLLVAFVVPTSTLASVIPTPGGVGGVEAAIVLLLSALAGVPVTTAAGIALLYRVTSYWFIVVLGSLAALWVSWR